MLFLNLEDGIVVAVNRSNISWRKNNKLHRLDGPALISRLGVKEFWIDGGFFASTGHGKIEPNQDELNKFHSIMSHVNSIGGLGLYVERRVILQREYNARMRNASIDT